MMGRVEVQEGKIVITIAHLPSLISDLAVGQFLSESISVAIRECFAANPDSFDPFSIEAKPC